MALNQIEVDFQDCCLVTRVDNPSDPNPYERIPLSKIRLLGAVLEVGHGLRDPLTNQRKNPYLYDDLAVVTVGFLDGNNSVEWKYDLNAISNQPTWTVDLAGLNQATADICAAINACTGGGSTVGLATEATLQNVEALLTGTTRTLNTLNVSGPGAIPAGAVRGSVFNFGGAAGTFNGTVLPAGLTVPIGKVDDNDTYNAINYDATGTAFWIEYTT